MHAGGQEGGVVVQHEVHVEVARDLRVDLAEELRELHRPMPGVQRADLLRSAHGSTRARSRVKHGRSPATHQVCAVAAAGTEPYMDVKRDLLLPTVAGILAIVLERWLYNHSAALRSLVGPDRGA